MSTPRRPSDDEITEILTIDQLTAVFGGTGATAAALEVRLTTFSNWRKVGMIPDHMHRQVQKKLAAQGFSVADRLFGRPFAKRMAETAN